MAHRRDSQRRDRDGILPPGESALDADPFRGWRWLAVVALAVVIFYWTPLTDPNTSPRWDAIDVHYSPQKYFSDHIREGELPFWTPYIFSGFPFLADPQVGAWYPPNWPFFLAGITPKAIQAELALHALIAVAGAYLLIFSMTGIRSGALVGALFYGFSGFFADHSQHVGMFSAAAWAPWLLWCYLQAMTTNARRWTAIGGLFGGCMVLAGHFQTALYAFCALGLFGVVEIVSRRDSWRRTLMVIAGMAALAAALSAVQTMPGLELAAYSERANVDYGSSTDRILDVHAFVNLLWPNATAVISSEGSRAFGYYLYSGLLLLPLAGLGLTNPRVRNLGAVLLGLSVWYMLGPDFGLYKLGAIVPGLHSVRAPVHGWFVAMIGLSMLAAGGADVLAARFGRREAYWLVMAVVFADVFFWNSWTNGAAYTRQSFEVLYGAAEGKADQSVASTQQPLTRYHSPRGLTLFGPLNHPLDLQLEATYGYNPLELMHYRQYFDAVAENPRLLAGLNVSRQLDPQLRSAAVPYSRSLPRAYFAKALAPVASERESRQRLTDLDPALETLIGEPLEPELGANSGFVRDIATTEQGLTVDYESDRPALLRLAVPYYPGWRATVGEETLPIVRVDHAFMGVVVPAGRQRVHLAFSSTYFSAGVATSLLAVMLSLGLMFLKVRPVLAPVPDGETNDA